MGIALFKQNNYGPSKAQLDKALDLDPKTTLAYFWRGQLLAQQGKKSDATADLEAFVALDPNFAVAYKRLSDLYYAAGQQAKAELALAKYDSLKSRPNAAKHGALDDLLPGS
ncbi:MAG TPA: tetratricopeptide repeat protein [Terriglobia bacterium]|nr:tetratricopeptide repeat protein [Terriglobia bacterium]